MNAPKMSNKCIEIYFSQYTTRQSRRNDTFNYHMSSYPYKLDDIPREGIWIPVSDEEPSLQQCYIQESLSLVDENATSLIEDIFHFKREGDAPFQYASFQFLKMGIPLLNREVSNRFKPENLLEREEKRQFSYHLFRGCLEACRFLEIDRLPEKGMHFSISQYDGIESETQMFVNRISNQSETIFAKSWQMGMPATTLYEKIVQFIRKNQYPQSTMEAVTTKSFVHELAHLFSNGNYFGFVRNHEDLKMLTEIRSREAELLFAMSSPYLEFDWDTKASSHFASRLFHWNNMNGMSKVGRSGMQMYFAVLNIAARFSQVSDSFRRDFESNKQGGGWIGCLVSIIQDKGSPDSKLFVKCARRWAPQMARRPLARVHAETTRNIKKMWGKDHRGKLAAPISCSSPQAKEIRSFFHS